METKVKEDFMLMTFRSGHLFLGMKMERKTAKVAIMMKVEKLVYGCWDESGCRTLFCTYKNGECDGIYIKYVDGSLNSVESAGEYKEGVFHVYDLSAEPKFVF